MIQWGSIPTYIAQRPLFSIPQIPYAPVQMPSIFQYNPFGTMNLPAYNVPAIAPTPQGISSWSNPFSGWFNFSWPNFSNFKMPTFNFSNTWNKIKTTTSNWYNSAKNTVSNTWSKVSNFASKIISKARQYLGFNEKDNSYKKFTNGRTEAWCADFATYVARESGANIPHFSGVSQILAWGRKNNRFSTSAKSGDLIIFKGTNSKGKQVSHTGIVTRVENGKVYTIEGNTSDKVAERSYSLRDNRITGYVSVA